MNEQHATAVAAGASPSIDERCAQVPVRLVPMRVPAAGGDAPMVDRLALVGEPVTSVIGRPVLATSDVDVTGTSVVHFNQIAVKRPTGLGPIDLLVIAATAFGVGFFVFFGGMLMLESVVRGPVLPAIIALVSMPLAAYASYRFSRRPDRKGWTCVVGEHGFQVGTVSGETLDRIVVVYSDPSDVWFETTTLGVLRGSSMAVAVNRVLTIRPSDALQKTTVELYGGIDQGALIRPLGDIGSARIYAERFIAAGEACERARAVRLDIARRELEAGRPVTMPTFDGRRITLTAGADGGAAPALTLELTRGGTTLLRGGPGEVTVSLREGTYTITAGGRRETIERHDLGNPYLLDAFFLGDPGPPIPDGPFPRKALVPAELAQRRGY
jgi:hypothetical protein